MDIQRQEEQMPHICEKIHTQLFACGVPSSFVDSLGVPRLPDFSLAESTTEMQECRLMTAGWRPTPAEIPRTQTFVSLETQSGLPSL